MKTRFLSGFLAVVGGGATIVGCFEPSKKVNAEAPRVVTTPAPTTATSPLPQQSVSSQVNTPAIAAVPPLLSDGVTEIAKLYQSNVGEDVLVAYINNYGPAFNPTADEILYLNDLGVSDNIITALINHKGNPNAPAVAAVPPPAEVQATAAATPAPEPAPQAATAPLTPQVPAATATAVTAPTQQAPVTVNYFYDTLSPYGSWVETEYGRCWRPAVVVSNPGWRPYCDRGHWIYTDCGWYWVSDYSWGWATFHYGRWCSDIRYGWVWVPDTCWGPSWVSWRYTSDHCGWAPLPPAAHFRAGVGFTYHSSNVSVSFDFGLSDSCYTFVPVNRFCDPHPYRYCAPRESVKVIYNRSTVVNNYIVNNNTTIVNEGIGRQRIEVATKQPVQKVAIHEWPKNSAPISAPDRIHHVGKDLVVYKPQAPDIVKPHFNPPVAPQNNSGSAWGGKGHTSTPNTVNTTTTGSGSAWGKAPAKPANSGNSAPRVPTQKGLEEFAAKQNASKQQQQLSLPANTISQPKHQGAKAREERPSAVAATPATPAPQVQTPAPRAQAQAPLVPQNSPSWGNSRQANEGPSRGNPNRFESPRMSNPSSAAQAQNTLQLPGSTAPSRSQQAAPRASAQQGQGSRGQGWGQGGRAASQGTPRSESSSRLAERDSGPGNGNGNGNGRGRN